MAKAKRQTTEWSEDEAAKVLSACLRRLRPLSRSWRKWVADAISGHVTAGFEVQAELPIGEERT